MKVSGGPTKQTDKASSTMLMVTFMKEVGSMTKLTAEVFTLMPMEQSMMENGWKTNNMEGE
jgi:hypothetical protein